MELLIALMVALLVAVGVGFFLLWKKIVPRDDSQGLMLLREQVSDLARTLDARLFESSKQVHASVTGQLGESARLIREVTEGLTKLDDTNRQVVGFAEELKRLQDILRNPKQRGVLGEYYLESVLKNVLPPNRYKMQYHFQDGDIVDAVIHLDRGKLLPVDSKFSLENYNRLLETHDLGERERFEKAFRADLKNRIDETSKYIRPSENTMEFAFMFIPSESIYYDLLVGQVGANSSSSRDLIEYAFRDKKVIIVSPTSFHAYLQTVLQGLRALEIEESAKEIRTRVEELGRHLGQYHTYFLKVGTSLSTVVNHYNAAGRELKKVDKDVLKIGGVAPGLEPVAVDQPAEE